MPLFVDTVQLVQCYKKFTMDSLRQLICLDGVDITSNKENRGFCYDMWAVCALLLQLFVTLLLTQLNLIVKYGDIKLVYYVKKNKNCQHCVILCIFLTFRCPLCVYWLNLLLRVHFSPIMF